MTKDFIIPDYDPNSFKLFSKCARDHASRHANKRIQSGSTQPRQAATIRYQDKKDKKVLCSFDMT